MIKGKRGAPPKEVRPTSGKVLGALFSILGPLKGRAFLDLFSGTGRVAYRAAQQGASFVAAVEILPARARDIRSLFSAAPSFLLLAMDIRRALSFLERKGHRFEIIFADPPYGAGWPGILGEILFPKSGGILVPNGITVIEHSLREPVPSGENYRVIDRREYGETVLSFLAPSVLSANIHGERGEEA